MEHLSDDGLSREAIYAGLTALIPELLRRCSTPRVSAIMNVWLDPLTEIQHKEAVDLLEEEANNE